jgi:hypothetical protein
MSINTLHKGDDDDDDDYNDVDDNNNNNNISLFLGNFFSVSHLSGSNLYVRHHKSLMAAGVTIRDLW